MQSKLDFLMKKYSVDATATLTEDGVVINGKEVKLLPWRNERRFIELHNLVKTGELNGISVMRVLNIGHKGDCLYKALYKEFDLCQFILGSKITEVFAVGDKDYAINVIAKTADGYVCTFEISATLNPNAPVIDKHEINALSGVACDRVTDTQVPQDSIYVYGESDIPEKYTDVDAELFGLSVEECAIVRSAFNAAKNGENFDEDIASAKKLVEAVKKSMNNVENVFVSEV